MAKTVAGDTVSRIYHNLTEELAASYSMKAKGAALRTLNPSDPTKGQARYLAEMTMLGRKSSRDYNRLSQRFVKLFSDAEGIYLPNSEIKDNVAPFDETSFKKRMMGAGVYGLKSKAQKMGIGVITPSSPIFQSTISAIGGDFVKHSLKAGRETVVNVSTQSRVYVGYGRVVDGNACDFCLMLATRNNYVSEDSAGFEAHRSCACSPEPVSDGWSPSPEALQGYEDFKEKISGDSWDSNEDDVMSQAEYKPEGENIKENEALQALLG